MAATSKPAVSRSCWLSAREQEAVITRRVCEPEKQVRGVRLGCQPAVTVGTKTSDKLCLTPGWHCM